MIPDADHAGLIGAGRISTCVPRCAAGVDALLEGAGAPWLPRSSEQLQKLAMIAGTATSPIKMGKGRAAAGATDTSRAPSVATDPGLAAHETGRTMTFDDPAGTYAASSGVGVSCGMRFGGSVSQPAVKATGDPGGLSRLLPPASPVASPRTPFATRATEEAARRAGAQARREAVAELNGLHLKVRVVTANWRLLRNAWQRQRASKVAHSTDLL